MSARLPTLEETMLEIIDVVSRAIERLRRGVFGAYLDAYCASLHAEGHPWATIREKLQVIARLSRWLPTKRLGLVDFDERRIDDFVRVERRRGFSRRGTLFTLLHLLAHLRAGGAVSAPAAVHDDSPGAVLLARFEEHLRRERALVAITITGYGRVVREFLGAQFDSATTSISALQADDVRAFMIDRFRRVSPRRAQYMATALRSFLRFLFIRGETRIDLAAAIPMVRQERFVSVPRHLPIEDVERLIGACDLSTTTGRRDHALVLLLARLGLRAGEIVALQLGDVRWREGEIVVRGKGQVHDRLPLLPDVGAALALYLQKDRPTGSSRSLFICRKAPHRGFSHPSSVSTIVMRALEHAGLTPPTRGAHLLRHSLATRMVAKGASFAEIGQVLRHRSPATTEIYAKVDLVALHDVARPWPGTGGVQ